MATKMQNYWKLLMATEELCAAIDSFISGKINKAKASKLVAAARVIAEAAERDLRDADGDEEVESEPVAAKASKRPMKRPRRSR